MDLRVEVFISNFLLKIYFFYFSIEMTEVGSKLTLNKDERHVLIKTMVTHLLDQSDGELRRLFDINLRELTEVTNTLVTICWNALQATWEALKSEPQLVQRGILRTEILKALGEIELALKRMDKDTREKPSLRQATEEKVALQVKVYELEAELARYKSHFGELPIEVSTDDRFTASQLGGGAENLGDP